MYERDDGHTFRRTLQTTGLSLDEAYGLLADRNRRIVIATLLGSDNSTPVDALVNDVLACIDVSIGDVAETRTHVATQLHHVHLPKLADAGLVEWDRDHEVVSSTERLQALAPFVESLTLDQFYR